MKEVITFTVFCSPEPQGSKKAFVVPGKNGGKPRAVVVDDNKATLRTYRQEITRTAMAQIGQRPWAEKGVPVDLSLAFFVLKPPSVKNRLFPCVKPDWDKLSRSTCDALTGVLYADDCQIVRCTVSKDYADVEGVTITARVAATRVVPPPQEFSLTAKVGR